MLFKKTSNGTNRTLKTRTSSYNDQRQKTLKGIICHKVREDCWLKVLFYKNFSIMSLEQYSVLLLGCLPDILETLKNQGMKGGFPIAPEHSIHTVPTIYINN